MCNTGYAITSPSGIGNFQLINKLINEAHKLPPAESPKKIIFLGFAS
jgi:hypothetical protein